jgi:hypothetical protein
MKFLTTLLLAFVSTMILAQCSIEYSYTVNGTTVNVVGVGSGAISPVANIYWDDANNTITDGLSGSFTYPDGGFYVITLLYYDAENAECLDQVEIQPIFGGACTLEFTTLNQGLTVLLNATGVGGNAETEIYQINWGDGNIGDGPAASHTYAAPGEYNICVLYTDAANQKSCTIEHCQTVVVTEGQCNVVMDYVLNGSTISVTASGSGTATPSYVINWGDGSNVVLASSGTHTYTSSGNYTVCVFYADPTDLLNCSAQDCAVVGITVGVEEMEAIPNNGLKVYPNPMNEAETIELTAAASAPLRIDVLDVTGRVVQNLFTGIAQPGQFRMEWNTASLSQGMYVVRTILGDSVGVQTCVKQ